MRVKVVEKSGFTLRNSLCYKTSWDVTKFGEEDGLICISNLENKVSCRRMGYTISCSLCVNGGILAEY